MRARALATRRALAQALRTQASETISELFLGLPELPQVRAVGVYLALADEVDTRPLIARLRRLERPPLLAAPVVLPDRRMQFVPLPEDLCQLEPGPFGVLQPPSASSPPLAATDLDLLVVPVVAFDRRGYRLGYGAGYYDRFLADQERREEGQPSLSPPLIGSVMPRPRLIGLAFAAQEVPSVPSAAHDIPLDLILTEAGTVLPARA